MADVNRIVKRCERCDAEFSVPKSRETTARYCSRNCPGSHVARVCEACRQPFVAPYFEVQKGWGRFCSRTCHDEYQRRHRSVQTCGFCRKEFTRSPAKDRHGYPRQFCSWACTTADYKRRAEAPTKWCARCETEKPASEFWRHSQTKRGRQKNCKACCLELQQEWVAAHPEEARALWRKHGPANEARRRVAGKVDGHTARRLFWFQEGRCYYCREPLDRYHLDHMTPIARGGNSDPQNLALACPTCNLTKATQTAEEFLVRLA